MDLAAPSKKPDGPAGNQPPSKYNQLLQVIEEMGRDVRPSYAGNKMAIERLKKNIHTCRMMVRECLLECEKSSRT
ncbi:hypothetical protein BOX15_Mlig016831g1 [Macrostomum lignano]|uniref:Cyclin-dependent kinase 2-associated protein 2 n=1 Tax=Macrostomum lignano TaxID=282301 RepID=A0A267FXY2_9PLAT|nr:hypothetical protein BOX15_Mlig005809g1 [Macrostomum lignano]PAA78244.1 hypothetical protein BOX15_Mlig005809g2 [Macrostomum lignano]PAA78698.1 hypothetical protein BOX15_Mlig016831g1 [Macrostomum lignano]